MSIKRDAHENVQLSINDLRNIEQKLAEATNSVENPQTKQMIENELCNVQQTLSSCETIESILSTNEQSSNRMEVSHWYEDDYEE